MIHRLRRKFILIAMGAVTLVMIMMCLSINIINFLTTDSDLEKTLQVLCDNQGTLCCATARTARWTAPI